MTASGAQAGGSSSTPRDRAHNMAGQIVDKVQETASRLVGGGQGSSGGQDEGVTGPVIDQATSRLDMGKDYVAETMTGVAQALRKTSQQLREEGTPPMLATYAERGAEQVERFGGYLRQHDASQLMTEMESFARRQPMVFSGAAFALGMLAVRFLRSEAPPQRPSTSTPGSRPYGASSMGTGSAGTWSQGRTATTSTAASTSMPSSGFTGTPATPSTGGSTGTQAPGTEDTQRLRATPNAPATPTPPPLGSTSRPASTPASTPGSSSQTAGRTASTPSSTPGSSSQTGGTSSPSNRTGVSGRPQP